MHYCSNGNGVYIFSINRSSFKELFSRSREKYICSPVTGTVYTYLV